MHRFSLLALVSLPLLASGCSPLEGEDSAGRGMEALMKVLRVGTPAALAAAQDDGRPDDFRAFGLNITGSLDIDAKVDCPDGGKMKLDGRATLNSELGNLDGWDAFANLAIEFDLAVDFRRCKVDGVKINGDMAYALDIDADSTTASAELEWSYVGDVRFSGKAEGTCSVDMSASASTGTAFRDLEVRAYVGTMCGFEAGEISGFADLSVDG